jgi:hypothetical protein
MAIQGMAKAASTPISTSSSIVEASVPQGKAVIGVPEDVWGFFGITDTNDRRDGGLQNKMHSILSYMLESNPESDMNSVLFDISRLEDKLGQPRLGVDRHDQIYQWIAIQKQISSLQKKAAAYERSR